MRLSPETYTHPLDRLHAENERLRGENARLKEEVRALRRGARLDRQRQTKDAA